MKNFEVANSHDPESIATASQKALISAIQDLIKDLKTETKNPGLTWEQLDYLLEGFKTKKVEIINQEFEQ